MARGRNVRVYRSHTTRRSRSKRRRKGSTGDVLGQTVKLGYGAILGNVAVGVAARA